MSPSSKVKVPPFGYRRERDREGELLSRSHQELDRATVVQNVVARRMTQAQAAARLKLSARQVKRLVRRYRREGARGLASRRRGRPGDHRIATAVREAFVALVKDHYADFGPTPAHGKLVEQHGLGHSVETLRQWMAAEGPWRTRARRTARAFQARAPATPGRDGADRRLAA